MKPGRELDALVAEHVFGWRRATEADLAGWVFPVPDPKTCSKHTEYWMEPGHRGPAGFCRDCDVCCSRLPHYSTDIAATWDVLAAMERISCDWTIEKAGGLYHVNFGAVGHTGAGLLATISIAALLAVGVTEVDE